MTDSILKVEVHDEMLDIQDPYTFDESLTSMEYSEYTPQTQANNNTDGFNIKIEINAQDVYTLPSKSYLCIRGQIRRRNNNAVYDGGDEITLINNAMMYLFSNVKYELGSTTKRLIILDKRVHCLDT